MTSASTGQGNVTIVSRAEWGAVDPTSVTPMKTPVNLVFIHHTDTPKACLDRVTCASVARGVQTYHMKERGFADIGYCFLIGGDGNIYEGRGWQREGAHTKGFNNRSVNRNINRAIGISFMGTFGSESPTQAALEAAQNLIAMGVAHGYISKDYHLYGHRQAVATLCPGDKLFSIIQGWKNFTPGSAK